jgi:tRNA U55 pseudouridine synthase TruB
VSQLEGAFQYGYWQQFIYPIDSVLSHWAAMVVSDGAGQNIKNGRPLVLEKEDNSKGNRYLEQRNSVGSPSENRCRAYALDGRFLGVLRFNSERGQWQPEKVFF